MVGVIEELRQNDRARTRFVIVLRHETSDADLAEALEQNPFVNNIELDLDDVQHDLDLNGVQRADWNSLLRVIATRANLETVKLRGAHRRTQSVLVRSILQAMSAEHSHTNSGVDSAMSFHRYIYVCGQCVFNHIVQAFLLYWRTRSKRSCGSSSAQHKYRESATPLVRG